mgnify:CR=1 FL=1
MTRKERQRDSENDAKESQAQVSCVQGDLDCLLSEQPGDHLAWPVLRGVWFCHHVRWKGKMHVRLDALSERVRRLTTGGVVVVYKTLCCLIV